MKLLKRLLCIIGMHVFKSLDILHSDGKNNVKAFMYCEDCGYVKVVRIIK